MLNTLDTVIAFAVIMTVVSLLITIVVQMVSAALSLRGKNLANALALTFQTIDPNLEEQAHSLANQILRDPIFSDSVWRAKKRPLRGNTATHAQAKVERAEKDLQLANEQLATVSTADPTAIKQATATRDQAQNAFDLAKQAVEEVKKTANVETLTVKANRTAAWGVFSSLRDATALGSAIRPGEIYRIVHEIADLTQTEAAMLDVCPELVDVAKHLLGSLAKPDQPANESKEKLEAIRKVADIFSTPEQQKAVLDSLANFGTTVERATTEAYDRFQRWFGSAQDRAEQWFQTHVRVVTIVCSICAAFILQLDTGEIYRQLRDQPKLVEALVKSAPGVLEQGGEIVEPSDTPAYHAYLLWLRDHPLFSLANLPTPADQSHYTQSLEKRLGEPPDTKSPLTKFAEDYQKASAVEGAAKPTSDTIAKAAYESWVEKFPKYQLPADYDFTKATKHSVTKDIAELVAKDRDNNPDVQALLQDYAGLQTEGAYAYERARKKSFTDLQKKLDEAGFDYMPTPFWGRWEAEHLPPWTNWCVLRFVPRYFFHVCWHLLGILATAGLLALGAPFWFNLLKNLMSLRPAVATLIEKRPTSAPALPAAPTSPPSPS
jgi:hypothetical protein